MAEAARTSTEGARILVVDPDPAQRDRVVSLMRHAGHDARPAASGDEAIRCARLIHPDLVLLEAGIAELDSLELCRRLKGDPLLSRAFVVHLGGGAPDRRLPDQVLEAGSDGFIARPLPNRELVARIEAMLRIHRAESALRRLQQRQDTRLQVGRVLGSAGSLDEAAVPLIEAIARGTGWTVAELWTARPGGDRLARHAAWHAPGDPRAEFLSEPVEPWLERGQDLAGTAWATGEPGWVPDVGLHAGFARREAAARHRLCGAAAVPVRRARGSVAVVLLFSPEVLRPDPDLLLTLADLGAQVGAFLDRVEAEEALRFQRNLFRAVVENLPDSVTLKGLDGRYLVANPASVQVFRRPVDEVLGRRDSELFPPEIVRRLRRQDAAAMGRGPASETYVFGEGDEARTLVLLETACHDEAGRIFGTVGVARDVTESRRNEDQMRLALRVEAMGRLAGGVAHDFNNLLTVITVNADLALQTLAGDDPMTRAFTEIRDAAERASDLTRQLLAYGRRQRLQPSVLDLDGVVTRMHPLLRRLIPENIAIRVVPAGGLDPVLVDPVQIEQVLLNLALNARDAMPAGGQLTLETRNVDLEPGQHPRMPPMPPGRYVRLAVTDEGSGMDAATQARIFEPFFTTKALGHGTGLGLAMVYGTVKQSGGWIWVDSAPGRGSTFEVFLPSTAAATVERAAEPVASAVAMPRGTETVLLVEDDAVVRDSLSRVLEQCGYRVRLARDGADAVEIVQAAAGEIDLVVTDVVMPHLSGPELAARLSMLRPGVRVLFVSGYADQAVLPPALLAGGALFVQKPFSPETLARRVREALDGPRPTPAG